MNQDVVTGFGAASAPWALQPAPQFADGEFDRWRRLIEERSGLAFSEARESYLRRVLAARLRELELQSYDDYYRRMVGGSRARIEWHKLLDRLAIGETRFFRDDASFRFVGRWLRERVRERQRLPRRQEGAKAPLMLWSLGCSTGEEAYSLAMVAEEVTHGIFEPAYGVWGTDISAEAIHRAREAVYATGQLTQLSRERRLAFLNAADTPPDTLRIVERIRSRACFARANLLDEPDRQLQGLDLIFCQNVLIYFRRWRRREILMRVAQRLAPGGVLVVGPGDVQDWTPPDCERAREDDVLAFIKRTGSGPQRNSSHG